MEDPEKLALAESSLRAALELSADDSNYLIGLDLAARWRKQPATTPTRRGWVFLAVVLTVAGAWWLAAPLAAQSLEVASAFGLGVILVRSAVAFGVGASEALYALATSPASTYSFGVLALLAVVLLAWPWSRDVRPQQQLA